MAPRPSKRTKRKQLLQAQEEVAPPLPSWPDDWPIQAQDPHESLSQSTLAPHPHVQQCSGSDIYVAKGAATVGKSGNKRKVLAILPGRLALQRNQSLAATSADKDANDDGETKDDDEETTANNNVLGQLHDVNSSHPKLTLQTTSGASNTGSSNGAGSVLLHGTQVQSSSKFLVLTIQPKKKKQPIVCKSIFDSIVVFGDAQAQGSISRSSPEDSKSSVMAAVAQDQKDRPLSTSTDIKLESTTAVNQQGASSTTKKDLIELDSDSSDNDDDSVEVLKDGGDEFKMNLSQDSISRRESAPRRSTKKPVRYVVDSDDEESEAEEKSLEEDDEDDSFVETKKPRKPAVSKADNRAPAKRAAAAVRGSKNRRSFKEEESEAEDDESAYENDDDDDESFVETQKERKPATSKTSNRARSKRAPSTNRGSKDRNEGGREKGTTVVVIDGDDSSSGSSNDGVAASENGGAKKPVKMQQEAAASASATETIGNREATRTVAPRKETVEHANTMESRSAKDNKGTASAERQTGAKTSHGPKIRNLAQEATAKNASSSNKGLSDEHASPVRSKPVVPSSDPMEGSSATHTSPTARGKRKRSLQGGSSILENIALDDVDERKPPGKQSPPRSKQRRTSVPGSFSSRTSPTPGSRHRRLKPPHSAGSLSSNMFGSDDSFAFLSPSKKTKKKK